MTILTRTDKVQSKAYRLIRPGDVQEVVLEHAVPEGGVVIEPVLGSICHADLRYFTGQRRPEALARKLPMALIHEGIGRVVASRSPERREGQRVVIVPNLPGFLLEGSRPETCCPACRLGVGDNYCHRGRFLGSGTDGIAQERLVIPAACAVPIPDSVPDDFAVLAELCSVSHQAANRVADRLKRAKRVAVFGDGPVGYLTAAVLHHVFGLTKERLIVFGAIPEKLNEFTFATRALVQEFDFSAAERADIAFECTGGRFSESAANQAIDLLSPGGALVLMGVTEERVPINTRDVLEKGLTLYGSSRSSYLDFPPVLKAMENPSCRETLSRLLPDERTPVRNAENFTAAMNEAAQHRGWKKTLLEFHW
jgi:ribitol-5-phosphate 2-dehydrogenase